MILSFDCKNKNGEKNNHSYEIFPKKKRGQYMIWLYIGLSLSKVFSNAKEHDKKP